MGGWLCNGPVPAGLWAGWTCGPVCGRVFSGRAAVRDTTCPARTESVSLPRCVSLLLPALHASPWCLRVHEMRVSLSMRVSCFAPGTHRYVHVDRGGGRLQEGGRQGHYQGNAPLPHVRPPGVRGRMCVGWVCEWVDGQVVGWGTCRNGIRVSVLLRFCRSTRPSPLPRCLSPSHARTHASTKAGYIPHARARGSSSTGYMPLAHVTRVSVSLLCCTRRYVCEIVSEKRGSQASAATMVCG